ncbi:hypothetical protein IQ22_01139 [Pseudomonas duriflava]|uniref:Retropepsin-like aspartic endopeptidase domain-containing protein n=1 Tax=Pseudomonas duriflava TaxID=459528 RepID=A0A562QIV0_9PSED|nr:ATP-dependent zinc protease [Pseudomonas duriflava]TWI56687.1 hypothetical protein IQ22_01139 [Pseudomonas duriflava]
MKRFLSMLGLMSLPALALAEPTLYGRYETFRLPELGVALQAKMDTGAWTASLSAKDIELFTREGKEWVRFRLATEKADDTVYEHRLARISKIKSRAEEGDDEDDEPSGTERPVIEMELCLGDQSRTVEVNLTDRSRFRYPLLIGAKALRKFEAAVDPKEKHLAGSPRC